MREGSGLSADAAAHLREILNGRRQELALRVQRLESELREPVDDDLEEQAADREDDEPSEALERSALMEMAAIEAALGRLDNGSYGRCVTCGEPIALRRLQLVPAATQCIVCAGGRGER